MTGGGWPTGTSGRVELPDGRTVVGSAAARVVDLSPPPQVVVRLDPTVPGDGWTVLDVDWPDFRLPRDRAAALRALAAAYDLAGEQRVAIACRGGRGRTGTALATVAVSGGVAPERAVAWVREHYRPDAVETRRQRRWVRRLDDVHR